MRFASWRDGLARGMKGWCKEFGARQGLEINFKSNELPRLSPDISDSKPPAGTTIRVYVPFKVNKVQAITA